MQPTATSKIRHVGRGKAKKPTLTKVFSQWKDKDRTVYESIEISNLLAKMMNASVADKVRIVDWLDLRFPDYDWRAEGPIEDWWGMGSVFCMELCIQVDIKVDNVNETITVVLS